MNFIKKSWICLFGIIISFILNFGYCLPILWWARPQFSWDSTPIVDDKEIIRIDQWPQTFSDKLEWILHLPEKSEYSTSLWYVSSLIQILVNWLLGILAFIALVYMIYCGFLVFSSGSDDKNASKGKKWISTAAIALTGIGLSWLIISAMIRFIQRISTT